MPLRPASMPDDETPTKVGARSLAHRDLGKETAKCDLGSDCPYAASMRWLEDERLKREQTQGEIMATVDRIADKVQKIFLQVEQLELKVLRVRHELETHARAHRLFELAVIALAAGLGGIAARWLGMGGK